MTGDERCHRTYFTPSPTTGGRRSALDELLDQAWRVREGFMIVCTICGYLTATLLLTAAPALLPGRHYLMIAAISVLAPSLASLIGGLGQREHSVVAGAVAQ